MSDFDSREFRNALGSFATGVTLITADVASTPVGMTVNSFASVSLSPPLILWSLDRNSSYFDEFAQAKYFSVHVLHSGQQHISTLFATKRALPFDQLQWHRGRESLPILSEYLCLFLCQTRSTFDGGDHIIIVGEVLELNRHSSEDKELQPLLFCNGQYQTLSTP